MNALNFVMSNRLLFPLLLVSPILMPLALAQPAQVPSTIKKLADSQVRQVNALPADPPQITPDQLQKLTGGPTLVTLSGTDLRTRDVVRALFEAAKLPENDGFALNKPTITINWNQTPFWVAAAEVEKHLGQNWSSTFGTMLTLNQPRSGNATSLDGKWAAQSEYASLILNSSVRSLTDTVIFGQKELTPENAKANRIKAEEVQLHFGVYFDPKLPVQTSFLRRMIFQKRGDAAPKEDGNPFGYGFRLFRGPIAQVSVPLFETRPGTVYSRISGVLHSVLVWDTQTFAVADLLATPKVEKTIGNNRYELQSATFIDNQLRISLTATAVKFVAQNWLISDNVFSTVRVRDAHGNEFHISNGTRRSGPTAHADYNFYLRNEEGGVATGPYSLEWVIPTETKSLDVPFELRDVVVP